MRLLQIPNLGKKQNRGFVLVTVLWAIVLISALALVTTKTFRREIRSSSRAQIHGANQTLADGFALLTLEQIGVTREFLFNGLHLKSGTPTACQYKERTVVVTATDSTGLVDLNTTPKKQLGNLLLAGGIIPSKLNNVMAAIIDYSDPDDKTIDGRSENIAYQQIGSIHLPKNSPFENIGELDQVAGMTAKVFSNIRPFLTVNSHKPEINPKAASPMLMARLNATPFTAEQNANLSANFSKSARSNKNIYGLESGNRNYEVRVMVRHKSGSNIVRQATGELAPGTPTGFKIINWFRSSPLETERILAAFTNLPQCIISQ